jgi:hypothetical protein
MHRRKEIKDFKENACFKDMGMELKEKSKM